MKTTIAVCLLVCTATGYQPHLRKLGNTPQPSYADSYSKPEKTAPIPWMPIGKTKPRHDRFQVNPKAPFGAPFGGMPHMPMGVPIAPDPNPNDNSPMNSYGSPFHIPEHGADFSNEDAWGWRSEQQMPRPGEGPGPEEVVWEEFAVPFGFGQDLPSFEINPDREPRPWLDEDQFFDEHAQTQAGIPDWRLEHHYGHTQDNHPFVDLDLDPNTHYHEGYSNPDFFKPSNEQVAKPRFQNNNNNNGARRRLVRYRPNREGPPLSSLDPYHHHQNIDMDDVTHHDIPHYHQQFYNHAPPDYRPMEDPNQQYHNPYGMPPPTHPFMDEQSYYQQPQFYRPPNNDWYGQQPGDIDGGLLYF